MDLEYLFREWRKNESWIRFCPMVMRFNLVNREVVNRVKTSNYGYFLATLEFANIEYWSGENEDECSIPFKDAIWEVVGIAARQVRHADSAYDYFVEWKAQNGRLIT